MFETLISLKEQATLDVMSKYLNKNYKKVITTKEYILAFGDIPIALVAHADTVFEDVVVRKELFYDATKRVYWCPQGAGFDDKAGIAAIIEIVESGLRPNVIITTQEETGAIGACVLAGKKCPFKDLRYIIQLDRRGEKDCVFYDCENLKFIDYVESFGFKEAWGTFSDISVLCPAWGVAGVNLSIGYQNEHTKQELLREAWYEATVERVIKMLQSVPTAKFKYVASFNYLKHFTHIKCAKCGKFHLEEDLFPVVNKEGKNQLWCGDCVAKTPLTWCSTCFSAIESNGETVIVRECDQCKKKEV